MSYVHYPLPPPIRVLPRSPYNLETERKLKRHYNFDDNFFHKKKINFLRRSFSEKGIIFLTPFPPDLLSFGKTLMGGMKSVVVVFLVGRGHQSRIVSPFNYKVRWGRG